MFDFPNPEPIERSQLDGDQLVKLLKARHCQLSQLQAEFYTDLLAVADAVAQADPAIGYEYAADEIAAALTWTRRRAEKEFDFAWQLADFPQIHQALAAGRIDLAKAKTIVFGLIGVDQLVALTVADKVLEKAERQTTGQIRATLRRLVITADPETATQRYEAGLRERMVFLGANEDGTANLSAHRLPPDRAALAFNRIDQYARTLATLDDPRSLDQIRSDVMLDLLIGCEEHQDQRGRKAIVDLRVDLATLLELNENPGEIPGWGPVIADLARQVAEQQKSQWRFYVLDDNYDVVAHGITRRRPTRPQRRRIELRHPSCVFPGCRGPSIHADIDHRLRYADGGPTEDFNLQPLCEHNHGSKDRGGWKVKRRDPHTYEWTSPLGQQYLVEVEPP